MIIVEQIDERCTLTYSNRSKWIRQTGTSREYESAVDYIPHTYEETDRDIEQPEPTEAEILDILLGGGAE